MAPKFHFITLFPDAIEVWLRTSILGKAHEKGLFEYELIQLRDFTDGEHHNVVLPKEALPILQKLGRNRRFVAKDAAKWFAPKRGWLWRRVRAVLEKLLRYRILERADPFPG